MEESKKKKSTATKSKQTSRSKNNPKKATVKSAAKKSATKKVAAKKVVTKKVTPKKEVKTKEEINLEKTLIVDGLQKQNAEEVVKNLEKESIDFDKDIDEKTSTRIIVVLILMIVLTIGIVSFFVCKELKNDNKKNDVKSDTNILEKINENSVVITDNPEKPKEVDEATYPNIVNISLSEFEQKVLKKENVSLLISKSTCSFCIEFEPVLNKVLGEQGKKVYRLNIYTMSKEEIDRFRGYYAFEKTPTIITVEEGILKSELVGSKSEDVLKDWVKDNI